MSDPYLKPPPILVVDDNEDDYEALAYAFRIIGLRNPVTLCTTGQAALDRLKTQKDEELPSLILLDLNMPGLDGFQVLNKLKNDDRLKMIPVVIWTTSSNEKDINACYRNGANAYMQKPVDLSQLVESVKHLREYWFETAFLPASKR